MRSKRLLLIVLPLLLIAGAGVFWFFSNQEGFTGSRVKNPDSYLLDIQRMNGTDLHTLELRKDDVLHIQFETEKGSLYVEITAPDGTSVYQGNGKEAADFTVNIPESGVYTVVVEARQAKGMIHINKYGVLPEYYKDLGDGIYQVYVEVGGEIVPFVTVNSATGDYHG